MSNEPDLRFDVDALFSHLTNNLSHEIDQVQDWHFSLSSSNIEQLELAAEELGQEYVVQLQENVEIFHEDDTVTQGDPMLIVIERAALTADQVKQIAARIQQIADERGLVYEGVECYESLDEEELFGWIDPEEAGWRLRHMTDCGLEENAELPWAFLIVAHSLDAAKQISAQLNAAGFEDRNDYDEPNDEGEFGVCVFVQGRNNEIELNDCAAKISELVAAHNGSLIGIQFYTREEVAEVFGGEEDI